MRKCFIAVLVFFFVVAVAYRPAAAQAPEPIVLTFQASWPAGMPTYEFLVTFAERVEVLSGGRLRINHLPAGAVVPAFDVFDATFKGVIDGAHTWTPFLIGRNTAAALFGGTPGGPFGMDGLDYLTWWHRGGGKELQHELFRDFLGMELIVFPLDPATSQLGWFNRPIETAEDLRGLKIRVAGIAIDLYKELGAATVLLPPAEIVPAAERGVIDAAEFSILVADWVLGFGDAFRYVYMPGWQDPTGHSHIIINKDVWARLPSDLQEVIRSAALETWLRAWMDISIGNAQVLQELGPRAKRTSDEILLAKLEAWERIMTREAEANPFFARVLESQREFAALMVPTRYMLTPPLHLAMEFYWREQAPSPP